MKANKTRLTQPQIQEMGPVRTSLGMAIYIKVSTSDYRVLSWSEIHAHYTKLYPNQWAVQFFPPADCVVDEANVYHLYVLEQAPTGVDIQRRSPPPDLGCWL